MKLAHKISGQDRWPAQGRLLTLALPVGVAPELAVEGAGVAGDALDVVLLQLGRYALALPVREVAVALKRDVRTHGEAALLVPQSHPVPGTPIVPSPGWENTTLATLSLY